MNDNEQWHDQGWDNQGEGHDNGWVDPGHDQGSSEHAPEGQDAPHQESGEQHDEAQQERPSDFEQPQGQDIDDVLGEDVLGDDVLGVDSLADADEVVMTTVTKVRAAVSRPTTAYSRINAMTRRRDRKSRVRILIEETQVEAVGARLRLSVQRPRLRFPAVDVIATSRAVADKAVAPTRAARLRAIQQAHLLRASAVSHVDSGRDQAVARLSAMQTQAAAAGHVGVAKAQGLVHDRFGATLHRASDPVATVLGRVRGRLGALRRDSGRNLLPHVDLPHVDLPHLDLPKVELPKMELPKMELPKVELPKRLELPKVDSATLSQPLVDLRAELRDDLRGFAQEADKVASSASEAIGRARRAVRR